MKLYKKRPARDYITYTLIIVLGVILDQLTKLIVATNMYIGESIPVIKDVFHFTFVLNPGAGFGMLEDQRWVFMVVSTVAIVAFSLYLYLGHAENTLFGVAMAAVVSGGIGNMIDRTFFGEVIDFIHTPFVKYPRFTDYGVFWSDFPVYNIADCFVTVGAALLILSLIISLRAEIAAKKKENKK